MFRTSFGRNVRRDSHSRILVQVDSQPTATTPELSGGSLTGALPDVYNFGLSCENVLVILSQGQPCDSNTKPCF